jgi:soluble lytic murein transglycosylase
VVKGTLQIKKKHMLKKLLLLVIFCFFSSLNAQEELLVEDNIENSDTVTNKQSVKDVEGVENAESDSSITLEIEEMPKQKVFEDEDADLFKDNLVENTSFVIPKVLPKQKPSKLFLPTTQDLEDKKRKEKYKDNLYFELSDLVFAENAQKLFEQKKYKESKLEAFKAKDNLIGKAFLWKVILFSPESVTFKEVADFIDNNYYFPRINKFYIIAEGLLSEISQSEMVKWFENQRKTLNDYSFEPKSYLGRLKLMEACGKVRSVSALLECNREKFLSDVWINHNFNFSLKKEKEFIKNNKNYIKQYDTIERINKLIWNNQLSSAKRILWLINDDYKNLFNARIALKNEKEDISQYLAKVPLWLKNDDGLMYDTAVHMLNSGENFEKILEYIKKAPKISQYSNRWWEIKRYFINKILEKEKNYQLAYELAASTNYSLEDNDSYVESQWFAGWISFKFLQNYKLAYPHFYNLYQSADNYVSKARGAFWAGHTAEKLGNFNVALNWFNEASKFYTSFYGQVAFNLLEKSSSAIPTSFSYKKNVDIAVNFTPNQKDLLKAINLFYLLGENQTAKIFITHFVSQNKTKNELIFISKFNKSLGRPDYMIESLKAMFQNRNFVLNEDIMPRFQIFDELKDFKLKDWDEPLVHAITIVESLFDPNARSPVGALGLMQVLPNTAKFASKELKIPYKKEKLTSDLKYNVTVGSFYINYLLKDYKHLPMAIAAYNAGPTKVNEWLKINPFPKNSKNVYDVIYWIESIPFYETRTYVQKVLAYYQLYKITINTYSVEGIIVGRPKRNIEIIKNLTDTY